MIQDTYISCEILQLEGRNLAENIWIKALQDESHFTGQLKSKLGVKYGDDGLPMSSCIFFTLE